MPPLKRKKSAPPEPPRKPTSFSLPRDLVARIERAKREYGYKSRSELVLDLLVYALDEQEKEESRGDRRE